MIGLPIHVRYLKILPLVGLAAFYLDSSFLDIRLSLPFIHSNAVPLFYVLNSAVCIASVVAMMYVVRRSVMNDLNVLTNTVIVNKLVIISQLIIISVIILTLVQLYIEEFYYLVNVAFLLILSYATALYFMGFLAYRFLSWFRYEKERIVLGFALTTFMIIGFLTVSIIYAAYEFSTGITPYMSSKDVTVQISGKLAYANIFSAHFYYSYIFTFLSVWVVTLIFLRGHIGSINPAVFYIVFSVPLIYFLLKIVPASASFASSIILYAPSIYGPLYVIFFSGTGPLGGVIFCLILLSFSRRIDSQSVRNYLFISALGILLFFVANQNPPLEQDVIPPFGLISQSFIGFSCYMIFLGIYSSVIYLSRKNTVTHMILRELSKDRFFGSMIRSEQEREIGAIVARNMEKVEEDRSNFIEDMSKEDIANLIATVRDEMSKRRQDPE